MTASLTESDAMLILNSLPVVGPVTIRRLMDAFDNDVCAIFSVSERALQCVEGVGPKASGTICGWTKHFDLKRERERLKSFGTQFISYRDQDYPPLLKEIWDAPLGLNWRGPLRAGERCVAIVGSRRCTIYGRSIAKKLAGELSQHGWCIVSGLARGIDTAAHEGALEAGGETIAVMGCGLDIIYPPENAALYNTISEKGAIVSEFPFGRRADRQTFPMRNRVISGMCRGVIVVESDVNGGAMITARFAGEQGRQVFAVPGRIDQASSRGCHGLIRDGAVLIRSAEEVLDEFNYAKQMDVFTEANPEEPDLEGDVKVLWNWLKETGEGGLDDASNQLDIAPAQVAAAFLMLELKGLAKKRADGKYEKLLF